MESYYLPQIKVFPEDASNKELEFSSSNIKVAHFSHGDPIRVETGRSGRATITCTAKDGSGVKASFTVTVPQGAWFCPEKEITLTDPEGAYLYYVTTIESGYNLTSSNLKGNSASIGDTKVLKAENAFEIRGLSNDFLGDQYLIQLLEERHIVIDKDWGSVHRVHLIPEKVGTSVFSVSVNRKAASINIKVEKSAIYESVKYDDLINKKDRFVDASVILEGIICVVEKEPFPELFVAFNGDDSKLAKIIYTAENSRLRFESRKQIKVKGVYTGEVEYITETGLTKRIPMIRADEID